MSRLPPRPDLDWRDGELRSVASDDGYFSRAGGLAESRAVFLEGCGLPEAWRGRRCFIIGELGFGTGLNALAAWDLWRRERPSGGVLHFISVEGFPLEREEAASALARFDEVAALRERLLEQWPVRARGVQRLWLEDGFALTVIHAPVERALSGLCGAVDAWFLDGFAPARNGEMWSAEVLARVAALSAPGARAASYSVAGHVRRALGDAGFVVEKREGFAGKRERLEARMPGACASHAAPRRVAIIGAGIAGASVASALTRRGVAASVFDAEGPASAASGNPVAIVSPRLDRGDNAAARFFLAAYLYALRAYGAAFDPVGVVHRPRNDAERVALADLVADPPLPPAHMQPHADGAFYGAAGIVRPAEAIAAMLAGAETRRARVDAVERGPDGWRVRGACGVLLEADAVVLAAGAALGAFAQTHQLPLQFTRGQMEWGPLAGALLQHVVEGGPYVAPYGDGVAFGATFDRVAPFTEISSDADSRARNLAALTSLDLNLAARVDVARLKSRTAVRAATTDRVPFAGAAPSLDAQGEGREHEGLFVIGGLGSRGFLSAPMLGETIACALLGEPQALEAASLAAIDPARRSLRQRT